MTVEESRILFLLYYFPPITGSAAGRNHRIACALGGKAASSVIFTSSEEVDTIEVPHNSQVQHINAVDYRRWLRKKTKDGALPESSKRNALAQWLIRLINTFPVNIIAGEGGLVYLVNVLTNGRRVIEENRITHLYSSYRPFTDHFAAWWLKKWYPHLVWIADFRDLIIDPHYQHILFSKKQEAYFKKLFRSADVLTTVSNGLAVHLKNYNLRVVTLRNGIAGDIVKPAITATNTFRISFTGSMFLDKRNAEPLFIAIQELIQETKVDANNISIIYAGKDSAYWKELAEKFRFSTLLDDRGIVSADTAKEIQDQSCINVLLTVSSDQLQGVLTGKMIEYFQAGSPVLGIVVGQNDPELRSMINELEIGDCFSDQQEDIEGIKDFIFHEYQLWKQTGTNRKPVNLEKLKSGYAQEVVTAPLLEALSLQ